MRFRRGWQSWNFGSTIQSHSRLLLDLLTIAQHLLNGKDQRRAELPLSKGSKKAVLRAQSRDESAIESI